MTLEGEYAASPWDWVSDQVEQYERTGGREANTFADTGLPIQAVIGAIFILGILLFRRGVVGELQALIDRKPQG